MSLAKHLKLFLLSFAVGLAFRAANADSTNSLGDWVILPAEIVATDRSFPENVARLWNPTMNEIFEVLRQLPDYLQRASDEPLAHPAYARQLPLLRRRLPKTGCQVIGVTYEGRKGILLNCSQHIIHRVKSGKKGLSGLSTGDLSGGVLSICRKNGNSLAFGLTLVSNS